VVFKIDFYKMMYTDKIKFEAVLNHVVFSLKEYSFGFN